MNVFERWSRPWSLGLHNTLAWGVDDTDTTVRWVCLRRNRPSGWCFDGAGQASASAGSVAGPWAQQGFGPAALALALRTQVNVRREVVMPTNLDAVDQGTWAKVHMAQALGMPVPSLSVDWGEEQTPSAEPTFWLAAARASAVSDRVRWAHERGAKLRILDAQSLALERVLGVSLQTQTDPIWLWWAGSDEGRLCTGWWHLGRWYERQHIMLDLQRLDPIPGVVLNLVRSAQARKTSLERMQWWWAGSALAQWAERWPANAPADCAAWVCRPAPIPFENQIEAATHEPAHRWSMALGLALHPGWS